MREIKFRGLNDYGWHVGHLLISYKDRAYIVTDMIDDDYANVKRSQEVELSTVGQYNGLKDKNGVEIYEGDILSYFGFKYEVVFEKSAFGWYEGGEFYAFAEMAIEEIARTDIVGNKYENPELLEEANERD